MSKKGLFLFLLSLVLIVSHIIITASMFILFVPEQREGHFWISLSALLLSVTLASGYLLFRVSNSKKQETLPAEFSIASTIHLYNIVVIFNVLLFWLILNVSLSWYIVIHLMSFLGLFVFCIFSVMFVISATERNKKTKKDISVRASWAHTVNNTLYALNNSKLKEEQRIALEENLNKLLEAIQFSDPVSHPQITEKDNELSTGILSLESELEQVINYGDGEYSEKKVEDFNSGVKDIIYKLTKRNTLLASLK